MKDAMKSPDADFVVEPLPGNPPFGATVLGLRLQDLQRDGVREALRLLWIDRGVLLFRQGDCSDEFHIELTQVFGPHQRHVFSEALVQGRPELTRVRYFPDDGSIYEVAGRQLGAWIPWHSDLKYTDRINRGGILRPLQLPKKGGGMTGFIDLIAAYESLPHELKDKIETLHAVYEMDINQARQRFGVREPRRLIRFTGSAASIMRRRWSFPRILHPMVYRQAETGRPVLNISPWFAVGVYEDGSPEGDLLLDDVLWHATQDHLAYYHDWIEGDLVLWDNWRTLHCATGVDPEDTRLFVRTTLAGDYALGRVMPGYEGSGIASP